MTEKAEIQIPDEDTQKNKYLTFSIGNESYGIEINCVTEIIGIQPITEVPELPDYIKGIINLRGRIIPVMDIRLRFRKESREYDDRTCVIVVDIGDISIGLIVDRVAEVLTIPDSEQVDPPEMGGRKNQYVKRIGKTGTEVKLLLDCEKLINEQDLNEISEIGG